MIINKEERKEMFYVTFYFRLYGVGNMVNNHSHSESGNLLPPLHGLLFLISIKRYFICTIPDRTVHTTALFFTPVAEHWLEQEIAQWVHHEGLI